MTETQDAAFRAWEAMFNWGMPPKVAVGFVTIEGGENKTAKRYQAVSEMKSNLKEKS